MQRAAGTADFGEAQQLLAAPRLPKLAATDLPAAADQAERSRKTTGGGWPEELTLEPCSIAELLAAKR